VVQLPSHCHPCCISTLRSTNTIGIDNGRANFLAFAFDAKNITQWQRQSTNNHRTPTLSIRNIDDAFWVNSQFYSNTAVSSKSDGVGCTRYIGAKMSRKKVTTLLAGAYGRRPTHVGRLPWRRTPERPRSALHGAPPTPPRSARCPLPPRGAAAS